jgi:hypothetical protein
MKYITPYNKFVNEGKFYQEELNPIFWKDDTFDQEIRTKLLQIATDFYTDLKVKAPIIDVHLTGSLANYNWTDHSDLDVHVILDFSEIGEDTELVKKAMDGLRFIWNLRHPVNIKGFDVELYAQDKNEPHVASGLYSLMKDEWITVPKFNEPSIDPKDVSRKVEAYVTEIEEIQKQIPKADSDQARELQTRVSAVKQKIMQARKDGLAKNGEFSIENLVFKELRNTGWLEKLIDLGSAAYSHIYSDPANTLDDQESTDEADVTPYKGSTVLVLGPTVKGKRRLFLFYVSWAQSVERMGRMVNMVGLTEPRVVLIENDRLISKRIEFTPSTLKTGVGLTKLEVVLNSKTKTPLWFNTVKFMDHVAMLNELSGQIKAIPDVLFV